MPNEQEVAARVIYVLARDRKVRNNYLPLQYIQNSLGDVDGSVVEDVVDTLVNRGWLGTDRGKGAKLLSIRKDKVEEVMASAAEVLPEEDVRRMYSPWPFNPPGVPDEEVLPPPTDEKDEITVEDLPFDPDDYVPRSTFETWRKELTSKVTSLESRDWDGDNGSGEQAARDASKAKEMANAAKNQSASARKAVEKLEDRVEALEDDSLEREVESLREEVDDLKWTLHAFVYVFSVVNYDAMEAEIGEDPKFDAAINQLRMWFSEVKDELGDKAMEELLRG